MSVSIDTDLLIWAGYKVETNFDGGDGGAAYAETSMTDSDILSFDRIISYDIVPSAPLRKEEFDLGSGLYPAALATTGLGMGEITLTMYVQTDDMYDIAISGTYGEIGTSIIIHIDNGIIEVDLFGCVVSEIKYEAATETETKQTVKFSYRNLKIGSALTDVAFQAGAISLPVNVSATIDGSTSTLLACHSITQTITNKLLEGEDARMLGDDNVRILPVMKREITIEVGYKDRNSNTWGAFNSSPATNDEMNKTAQFFDATIVWHTTLSSVMENITLDNTNSGTRSEHGLVKHVAAFKQGVGQTIA